MESAAESALAVPEDPSVSHIPPELLAQIFAILVDDDRPASGSLGWIKVTHTCRRWRRVALDHPILWRDIIFSLGDQWTAEIYARAQSTPILVKWDISEKAAYSPRKAELVLENLWHTEQLALYVADSTNPFVGNMVGQAPILEDVYMSSSAGPLVILPTDLFGRHAPRLSRLFLSGYSHFPWSSPAFDNLISLEIRNDGRRPLQAADAHTNFLDALDRMHVLETLVLVHVLPRLRDRSLRAAVTLSHLTTLELTGKFADCTCIMAHLHLPALVALGLECILTGAAEQVYSLFPIMETAGVKLDTPIHTFSVDSTSARDLTAIVWTSTKHDDEVYRPADLSLAFQWGEVSGWDELDMMQAVCSALSLRNVFHLSISFYSPRWTTDTWFRLFGLSNSIMSLDVFADPVPSLCEALSMSFDEQTGRWHRLPTGHMFLPELETLELGAGNYTHRFAEADAELHEMLPKWLRQRKERGSELQFLVIYEGSWKEEWMRPMRSMLPSLGIDAEIA